MIPKPESATDYYDIDIPYDASLVYEAAPKIDGKEYKIGLVGLSFNKQMYQPGEILARLHISQADYKTQGEDKSYFLMTQKVLNDYFLGRQTKLQDDKGNVIAQDYFVYEVIPEYTPTSLYVDLKIYSPDKLLTLGNFCRSFVARRLGADIITTELANYLIP